MSEQNLSLHQNQGTLLQMTPQQVQFVRMLEMTTPEIEEKVRRELDDNPALETVENHDSEHADDLHTEPGEDNVGQSDTFNESADQLLAADYRSEDDMPPATEQRLSHREASYLPDNPTPSVEINADALSPVENLRAQLGDFDLNDYQYLAADYIIGSLDTNGRLTRSLEAIADDIMIATGVQISPSDMETAFDTVRALEPAGVGAVDLRDCLLLQLRRRRPVTLPLKTAIEIVDKHFKLLTLMHYQKLAQVMGIDNDTLKEGIDIVRTLNPKPWTGAETDSHDRMRHVIPDFVVERRDDGSYSIWLTQHLPDLDIERSFRPEAALENHGSAADRAFIRSRREEARTFIDLLQRRKNTLLSVMQAIVTLQSDFFATEDPMMLKPMILKDVARITGLDLSVISRATSAKYVSTGGAVYPLKMFFNERSASGAEDASTRHITNIIKELIDNEDGNNPLSDQDITKLLADKGFELARRTVAKYRENLHIPVARLRKKI